MANAGFCCNVDLKLHSKSEFVVSLQFESPREYVLQMLIKINVSKDYFLLIVIPVIFVDYKIRRE